ncbi:MAG TPA: hypothetical protein VF159_03290 [Gemmatimonadaceae bacterium]
MADTTNFGWSKPTVGGDTGAWGAKLNDLCDDIDADLKTVKDTADGALPKAGGAMSGRFDAKTATLALKALGAVSGSPVNLDCSLAQYFTATLSGATTFAFTNVPNVANTAFGVMLRLTNGGSAAITWPASVKWPDGAAPTLTVSGVDLIAFVTDDGGTTWRAFVVARDVK